MKPDAGLSWPHMASLFLSLTDWIMAFVAGVGYPGIFLLMIVEGILTPIPSEFIMPFAGSLAAQGRMDPALVVLAGTAGAAIGNFVAYHIGSRVGRPVIARYGRYIGLGEQELEWAENWFARYGALGVLLGHAVPGIRSFISFPAGIGKMRLRNFIAFSTAGAAIWNTVLVIAGFYLVDQWIVLATTTDNIDLYVALAGIFVMIGYVYWRRGRGRRASR